MWAALVPSSLLPVFSCFAIFSISFQTDVMSSGTGGVISAKSLVLRSSILHKMYVTQQSEIVKLGTRKLYELKKGFR